MAKQKLPKAYLWRERELNDWNTDTFLAYLKEKHEEVYGIKYVHSRGGFMQEKGMIKKFIDANGKQATKDFIDYCFANHKASADYPGLNFWFMKVYLEQRFLPRVLKTRVNEQKAKKRENEKLSVDDMLDLL
jgi:nitrogenase molybdenum-iron protein alpha/beta subunit